MSWCTGLIEDVSWMCDEDLAALCEEERRAASGLAPDITARIWGIEVLQTRGRAIEARVRAA